MNIAQTRLEAPAAGWYRFDVSTPQAVLVFTLRDDAIPAFVEITATSAQPVYAKLQGGSYSVSLRAVETGEAPLYSIRRLGPSVLAVFFIQKTVTAIAGGQSIGALWGKVRRAFDPGSSFGAAQAGTVSRATAAAAVPGPLAQQQWTVQAERPHAKPGTAVTGPLIFVDISGTDPAAAESLASQTYGRWTTLPDTAYDFSLKLDSDARLIPEALETLAAAIQSETRVVYADVWLGQVSTYCFGYDPLLNTHADTLSDLVLVHSCLDKEGALSCLAPGQIVRISQPLAFLNTPANTLNTGARRPAILPKNEGSLPKISCIIPTRDRADLLATITRGLLEETQGAIEIVVVDNGSTEPQTRALFEVLAQKGVRIITDNGDFNFSRLCNLGATMATGELLAFINNDIAVRYADWLVNMAQWAVCDDVGAVGTRLLYADESLQHGGVTLGLSGHCGHLFRGWPKEAWAMAPSLIFTSTRMAVTGAALMVEASKFHAISGFDEAHFPVTLNDVDLCLRLRDKGWKTVYEATSEAFHLEGVSRGEDESAPKRARRNEEIRQFIARWGHLIDADQWFSPALSRAHEDVRLL